MPIQTELDALMKQLEEMWDHQNTLFSIIDKSNGWGQRHGPDWTFIDSPYHLAYCNHDLVARPIELGEKLPKDEQYQFKSPEDINSFNAQKFKEKPEGLTGTDAWGMVAYTWEEIRDLTAEMADDDLQRPFWLSFNGGGWMTVMDGLYWMLLHDWSEFTQLRIHMGRSQPVPSPEITTRYLSAIILDYYPLIYNRTAADGMDFTTQMEFSDPLVGPYAVEIMNGNVEIRPGGLKSADLVLTQSTETFEKIFRGILTTDEAIAAGDMEVSNPKRFNDFRVLFPIAP